MSSNRGGTKHFVPLTNPPPFKVKFNDAWGIEEQSLRRIDSCNPHEYKQHKKQRIPYEPCLHLEFISFYDLLNQQSRFLFVLQKCQMIFIVSQKYDIFLKTRPWLIFFSLLTYFYLKHNITGNIWNRIFKKFHQQLLYHYVFDLQGS